MEEIFIYYQVDIYCDGKGGIQGLSGNVISCYHRGNSFFCFEEEETTGMESTVYPCEDNLKQIRVVVTHRLPVYSVVVRYPCMAINDIVQYTPTFFWLNPSPYSCSMVR